MGFIDLGPYTTPANLIFLLVLSVAIFTFILLIVTSLTVLTFRPLLKRIEGRLRNLESLLGSGKAATEGKGNEREE